MSRSSHLELISLTTNFLKTTKPQSCKNYRVLSQEPLFRGICYGASQFNITPEEIEQEVSKLLKFSTSHDDKQFSIENAHIDEILPYILKFKPDEISRLPTDLQKRILNQWIVFQKGFTKARQNEFDKVFGNAMKILNLRLIKSISDSISSSVDSKSSSIELENVLNNQDSKNISLDGEKDKNESVP